MVMLNVITIRDNLCVQVTHYRLLLEIYYLSLAIFYNHACVFVFLVQHQRSRLWTFKYPCFSPRSCYFVRDFPARNRKNIRYFSLLAPHPKWQLVCVRTSRPHARLTQIYTPIIFGCGPVHQFRLDKDEWKTVWVINSSSFGVVGLFLFC